MNTNRRTFIAGACGALVAGIVGLEAALPANAVGVKKLKNGKMQLTISKLPKLAKAGGVVGITVRGAAVAVVCTAPGRYSAFDLRCPHQGVTVNASGSTWVCPAHQSVFDPLTGDRLSGPTPRGLTKVKTAFKAGVLTVG
jgi:Rieske Fe-S protein